MKISVLSFVACLMLAGSVVDGNKHNQPTPAPTHKNHHNNGNHNTPAPAPTETLHHAEHLTGGSNNNHNQNTPAPVPAPTEGLHHAEHLTGGTNPAPAPETDSDQGAPVASSDVDKEIESQEEGAAPVSNAQAGDSQFQQELGEFEQEAKEDFQEAEQEIMDFASANHTAEEFEGWFHNNNDGLVYPEETLPPATCEETMKAPVQTYWDLLYSMVAMALLTILIPYLFSCFMGKTSFSVMRCVAIWYYFSGALHTISGLLLSTALMPKCPAECGEFFCTLQEYNPGPIYGVVVFFVGVLWLLKGVMLQCRASKAEREYLYQMHLKNGGTATSERQLTTEEQHELHVLGAQRRAGKPSTRPAALGTGYKDVEKGTTAELI